MSTRANPTSPHVMVGLSAPLAGEVDRAEGARRRGRSDHPVRPRLRAQDMNPTLHARRNRPFSLPACGELSTEAAEQGGWTEGREYPS